jgi:hypothetical protein
VPRGVREAGGTGVLGMMGGFFDVFFFQFESTGPRSFSLKAQVRDLKPQTPLHAALLLAVRGGEKVAGLWLHQDRRDG